MNTKEQIIHFNEQDIYLKQWMPENDSGKAPIILFHDSLGSVELWRTFPESLAKITARTVIAYDRLGFGKSSQLDAIPALNFIEQEADTTFKRVIEYLQLECFILMGHSVGGGIATCCAANYPEQTKALITIAAQSFVEDRTLSGIKEAKLVFQQPEQMARLEKYHKNKAEWVLNAWTETWCHPDFKTWSLIPQLKQITCPNLIIHGELDEYGSNIQAENFQNFSSGHSELHILEGCHHLPHKENLSLVLDLIEEFLIKNKV
jgi:pimeloyl-ACP methyl ester carboxylesterase